MIDRAHIGRTLASASTEVEKGRLRFFAKAIGETDPIYTDESAARDAGHRSLPVPPTYYFCLPMLDTLDPTAWVGELGVNLQHILHGEQSFEYFGMAYAGDTLAMVTTITDIYEKKGGALEFVVTEMAVSNQLGELVAKAKCTLVVRNPGVKK